MITAYASGSRSAIFILFLFTTTILPSGIVAAQAPGGVAGPTAWFRADNGLTVNPATNVATAWTNSAANPNLVTLTTTGGTNTLVSSTPAPFNFNRYILCNNAAFSKDNSGFLDVVKAGEGTTIGVGTQADQLIVIASNSTAACSANRCNTGTRGPGHQFGNTQVAWQGSAVSGVANIFGGHAGYQPSPMQVSTLNGLHASGSAGTRSNDTYRFAIGSFPGYFYNGSLAEAICFDYNVSAGQFRKLESYLALKYGITLGNTASPVDYVASDSSLTWAGNSTYQNYITGIGRDDNTLLLQKQSKAVRAGSFPALYNGNTAGVFPAMNTDNTTSFLQDKSFLLFGDDQGDTALNVCWLNGKALRMNRTWQVQQKSGVVGPVTLAFDAGMLSPAVTMLAVSNSPAFAAASTALYPLQTGGGKRYASLTLSDGQYFTFSADTLHASLAVTNLTCTDAFGAMLAAVSGGLPPYSYTWNTVPAQTTAAINNLAAGIYTVTVHHGGTPGCNLLFTDTVLNKRAGIITTGFNYDIDYGCTQDKVSFTNLSTGNGNYTWSFGDNNSSPLPNPSHIYTRQNAYTVKLVNLSGYCKDSIQQIIDLNHPLSASFTVDKDTLCQFKTVSFTNTSTTTTRNSIAPNYEWDFGDGSTSTIENPTHNYTQTGIFRVVMRATDFVPCTDSAVRMIYVDTASGLNLTAMDTVFCAGQAIMLKADYLPVGFRQLTWDFGDDMILHDINPITHAYDRAGIYTIKATAAYRVCPDTSFTRTVRVKAFPTVNLGPDTFLCPNAGVFTLSDAINANNPTASWQWNTGLSRLLSV